VNHALELRDVRKTFGPTVAVDGLSLAVPRGGLYGFIGPSGAGKTTCIRMIMSILHPDAGDLTVLGAPSAVAAKDRIGYLPEERGVYRKMRVAAFLAYIAELKGLRPGVAAPRISRLLERVGLQRVERLRCEELSKGMLQRVQFVAAILHEPDLLILDEPFSGLDPVSVRMLREQVQAEHRRGATILLSTHVMAHAEEICSHVVMIHRGRKVLDEPVASLRRQYDPRTLFFEPFDPDADLTPLTAVPGVERLEPAGTGHRVTLAPTAQPADVIPRIAAAVLPARIEVSRLRLEDVFVRIVLEEAGPQTPEAERSLRADLGAAAEEAAS
jgi:ABC-2 type transport system ATP-binding protein